MRVTASHASTSLDGERRKANGPKARRRSSGTAGRANSTSSYVVRALSDAAAPSSPSPAERAAGAPTRIKFSSDSWPGNSWHRKKPHGERFFSRISTRSCLAASVEALVGIGNGVRGGPMAE
jgi:hypothetical protein